MIAKRRLCALVVLLLTLHALASLWSASRESATWDEPSHIGAGYAQVALGNPQLKPLAAPLVTWIVGASIQTLKPGGARHSPSEFDWNPDRFGYDLLYDQGDHQAILWRARLPMIGLSLLLGLAVFLWAHELWGSTAGLAALFLYVANSEMLAHSHYLTLDLPMALMATVFLWGLWRFLRRPSQWHGVWVSVAFGLAVVTKYSFPALALMGAGMALLTLLHTSRQKSRAEAAKLAKHLMWLTGVALLVTWLVVWTAFGFRAEVSRASEAGPRFDLETLASSSPIGPVFTYLRDQKIFPEGFTNGLVMTALLPHKIVMAHFGGRVSPDGWWYYFPIAFLLKTPLPLLLLLAMTPLVGSARERERFDLQALAVAVAVYMGLAMSSPLSIGYRHLLPCIPLLLVWAGWVVKALWTTKRLRWLAMALLVWYGLGAARVAPHFLSFFNELAGGPDGGHRYLVDSNTDWGQDLDELARMSERLGLGTIKLSYFGSASPDAAGISYSALPGVMCCWKPRQWASEIVTGDVVAVSVTNLRGVYFRLPGSAAFPYRIDLEEVQSEEMPFVDFLEHLGQSYHPFARTGHSILLYRLLPEYRK